MINSSTRDRMKTRAERIADWKKPRTGNFIDDFIKGNKAAIEALRRASEEWEKRSAARASQSSKNNNQ